MITRDEVKRIIEEERLFYACNFLENRPDGKQEVVIRKDSECYRVYQTGGDGELIAGTKKFLSEDAALDAFISILRSRKTQQYDSFLKNAGMVRTLRTTISKTFVSRYDFEAEYHELFKGTGKQCFSVIRMDPAPGGCGEEFMYIKDVFELESSDGETDISDEELTEIIIAKGKKVQLI